MLLFIYLLIYVSTLDNSNLFNMIVTRLRFPWIILLMLVLVDNAHRGIPDCGSFIKNDEARYGPDCCEIAAKATVTDWQTCKFGQKVLDIVSNKLIIDVLPKVDGDVDCGSQKLRLPSIGQSVSHVVYFEAHPATLPIVVHLYEWLLCFAWHVLCFAMCFYEWLWFACVVSGFCFGACYAKAIILTLPCHIVSQMSAALFCFGIS